MKYKLKEFCKVINGRAYRQEELLNAGKYRVLRVGNFFSSDNWYYSNLELPAEKYCQNGDLLFAWACSFGPRIWEGEDNTIFHYHIWKLDFDDTIVDKYYLFYLLKMSVAKMTAGTHGSVMMHITKSDMENFEFDLPLLEQQKRIASVLSAIDDKIETNKRINDNLEQQVSALFDNWLVDFGRFDGDMPIDWHSGKLADIANVTSGKRPPLKSSEKTASATIPLVGAASVMGYTSAALYDSPILVTGRVGTHGVVQRFYSPCWPSDNTLVITSPYYEFTDQVLRRVDYINMNRGSTQPLITQTDLKNVEIVIPSDGVLKEFELLAGTLMQKHAENCQENQRLCELRDALLPHLMSGEIDVSDVQI